MSESSTTPTLQPAGRRQPTLPAAMRTKLAIVVRGKALMLAMRQADAMHLPAVRGHTKLHALAESTLLDRGLGLLAEICSLEPPQPVIYAARPDLARMEAAQSQLAQTAPEILALCIKASFPEPEIVAGKVLPLLQRTAAQQHGFLREAGGHKAWARELQPVVRAARSLAVFLDRPAGAAIRAALPQQLEEVLPELLQTPTSHHAGRSLGELLPGLLNRFAEGLEAQLAAAAKTPGRPRQPEALIFGAQGLLALWRQFHPRPPSMRNKVDGFVGWAAALLRLAVEANDAGGGRGAGGSDMLDRTTLTRVLNTVVAAHRRDGRPPQPGELHPAWKQGRASDECICSHLHVPVAQADWGGLCFKGIVVRGSLPSA